MRMGPENVLGVMMPSRYSSQGSVDDSVELARNLGIQTMLLPISDIMETYDGVLADAFAGLQAGRHRGEHPIAHPRQSADGALQQIRRRCC